MTKGKRHPATFRLGPYGLRAMSNRDFKAADVIVCAPVTIPLLSPDNLVGPCSTCGQALQWRPDGPKRPARICFPCLELRLSAPAARA